MTTKKPATKKVVDTVSPEPDDAPAGAAAAGGGVGPVGGAPASGRAGVSAAGTPHGHAAWVVPAPVALAVAPVGSSGYYVGVKVGVDTKTGPFAGWLGTDGPRAAWPN